jgi:hypothetical protein
MREAVTKEAKGLLEALSAGNFRIYLHEQSKTRALSRDSRRCLMEQIERDGGPPKS